MIRQNFYETEKLVLDVEAHLKKLDKDHTPDYLTFVANGEPTLDINLGREIKLLKKSGIPIAVITNSSLMHHKHVQDDLMEADWVSVKVDAIDVTVWEKINRPLAGMDFEKILVGLRSFASRYKGKLNTETMLVQGYNDMTSQLKQSAAFIAMLKPQKVYLSIPTRPPAVRAIKPVQEEKLTEAWQIYQEAGLTAELLTGFEGTDAGSTGNAYEDILNIAAVHPLREDIITKILEKTKTSPVLIDSLVRQGLIKGTKYRGKIYYVRNYHFK
jgi:wyosine [tRNA(Phe)-imidazoG37] synthetase (radical SAM superfamily)